MCFQHDGAPPHYTRHVRVYLNESFPNRWLGHGEPVAWAPSSADLKPLDYYLWSQMETLIYETKVESKAAQQDFFLQRLNTYVTIQATLLLLLGPCSCVPKTA